MEEKAGTHRVPDLQLDLFALDVDHPGAELDTNGEIMNWLKPFISELKQQTRLANSCNE